MTIEHLNYINTDPINDTTGVSVYFADKKTFEDIKSMDEDSLKEIFGSQALSDVEFSPLPTGDGIVFVYEDDSLADDEDWDEEEEEED